MSEPAGQRVIMLLEVCVDSVAGVRAAFEGGAERVELCSALEVGGLTPSLGLLAEARAAVPSMKLYAMLRPRVGDFLYSDDELRVMRRDLVLLREAGADGIVLGLLTVDGDVDLEHLRELVTLAHPLPVTFHRAFDLARDPFTALDALMVAGVHRLLTSGQSASLVEGVPLLTELVRRAGDRLVIMPGGGVRDTNVSQVLACGAQEVHASGRNFAPTPMRFDRPIRFMESSRPDGERQQRPFTDAARIRAIYQAASAARKDTTSG